MTTPEITEGLKFADGKGTTYTPPFIVNVPGFSLRKCRSQRGAETTMGRLMAESPMGTLGMICQGPMIVLVGRRVSMGWEQVL